MKDIAILRNGQSPKEQALLLPGRSPESIRQKRHDLGLFLKKKPKEKPPAPKEEYTGKRVPLYQFISTKEATPARIKEWGRLTREEERAMQTV